MKVKTNKEGIKYEAHLHWMVYYPSFKLLLLFAILIFAMFFFNLDRSIKEFLYGYDSYYFLSITMIPFVFIGYSIIAQSIVLLTTKIYLTSSELFLRSGLFNIKQAEFPIRQIESTSIHQDIWGKIFNYGIVTFYGTGGHSSKVFWVTAPSRLTEEVNSLKKLTH